MADIENLEKFRITSYQELEKVLEKLEKELTKLKKEGFGAYVLFVIQMEDVRFLYPNDATDPAFGKALREASQAGVLVMAVDCTVTESTMQIRKNVPVRL